VTVAQVVGDGLLGMGFLPATDGLRDGQLQMNKIQRTSLGRFGARTSL
jgi:hypothetical protein